MAGTAARRTLIKLVGAGTVSAALTAFGTQPANARTASDPQQASGATDTSAIPRVGILTTNATALVQEGTLTAQWVTEYTNVRQLVVDGTRIGIVTTGNVALVKEGVTLRELVDGLNALGIGPRDLIAILQAIKAAGALQADIEVM